MLLFQNANKPWSLVDIRLLMCQQSLSHGNNDNPCPLVRLSLVRTNCFWLRFWLLNHGRVVSWEPLLMSDMALLAVYMLLVTAILSKVELVHD